MKLIPSKLFDRDGNAYRALTCQINIIGFSNTGPKSLLYSFKRSFNGFAAKLIGKEAQKMAGMEGVVSVFPNKQKNLHTTRSWDFLGFPQQVERTTVESDIIIGVLDMTGSWPESDSFSDKGFGLPPSKWRGVCRFSTNFTCNNNGDVFGNDIRSPRDSNCHGTHTASIAAGNIVNMASVQGIGLGTARGGVPLARIAVYKICWLHGCSDADILAAFDDAIADGVDLISISLGGTIDYSYFNNAIAIGAFHAMRNGILTSNSAGNGGPGLATLTNISPWSLSVAASTIDRKFFTEVQLDNDNIYEGVSINTFDLKNEMYPMVYGGDAPNTTAGSQGSYSRSPTATILKTNKRKDAFAPYIPYFSSRGPNVATPNIFKSDLAALRLNILAAWSPISPISRIEGDNRKLSFNILSGTSMACPHATGAAAYVKSLHPKWSPPAIKSALMTTADPMSAGKNPEVEFAYGAGNINPSKAPNPGLIYDIDAADYINFLCGQGYNTKSLQLLTGDNNCCRTAPNNSSCFDATNGTVNDLNYPAFALSTPPLTSINRIFNRIVTNVGSPTSTYKAILNSPLGLTIKVTPNILSFTSLRQKLPYTLSIEGTIDKFIVSASLTWDDGTFQVRSPIA
ncbi:hypothetical protein I3842_Q027900, partial [Carya illinoinensis]